MMATTDDGRARERIKKDLERLGLDLVSACIGRTKNWCLTWNLVVAHPQRGVAALVAEFRRETQAYAEGTLVELAERVARHYQH